MRRMFPWLVTAMLLLSACAAPRPESAAPVTPAYVPANAAPPAIAEISNGLVGAVWRWERTQHNDGRSVSADAPERFTLSFEAGGRVNLRVECNRGAGPYEISGNTMRMGPFATTKMLCQPGSKDGEFLRDLENVNGFTMVRGQLGLALSSGGVIRFTKQP